MKMKTEKPGKARIEPVSAASTQDRLNTQKQQGKAKNITSAASPTPLTSDMIAQRAWAIWMSKGCLPDQDEANWRQAERELRTPAKRGE